VTRGSIQKKSLIIDFLQLSAEANVTETFFYFHQKVRPSTKPSPPKVAPAQN